MFLDYPVSSLFLAISLLALVPIVLPTATKRLFESGIAYILVALLFVVGMVLLASKNHLLGDGLTLLGDTQRVFAPTEPLDVLTHHLVYKLTGSMLASYRIVAFIAGAFYLLGVYFMTGLARERVHKAIIALVFLSTATIQFYFGYAESYTLRNLFILYFIYFAWRDLTRKRTSYAPLVFFFLAVASHFSAIVLLPSLVYLFRRRLSKAVKYLLTLLVLIACGVALSVGTAMLFVPLTANSFSAYSLLSWPHLRDIASVILLTCPAFFLALLSRRKGRVVRFMLIALIGTLCFTFFVDPKIGALRDWDLLSVFAIPLCALVALRAPRKPFTLAVLIAVVILRTIPWLVFNSSLQTDFIERVVDSDIHYSCRYDNGWRLVSWGILLSRVGDFKGAESAFQRRLGCLPGDEQVLGLLAPVQYNLGNYQGAYESYRLALQKRPNDVNLLYKSIYAAFRAGKLAVAESLWDRSPTEFKNLVPAQRLYAAVIGLEGHYSEAAEIIKQYPGTDQEPYLPFVLAGVCLRTGDSASACLLAQRATELDSTNREYKALMDSVCSR
jgi:hypothetical protein